MGCLLLRTTSHSPTRIELGRFLARPLVFHLFRRIRPLPSQLAPLQQTLQAISQQAPLPGFSTVFLPTGSAPPYTNSTTSEACPNTGSTISLETIIITHTIPLVSSTCISSDVATITAALPTGTGGSSVENITIPLGAEQTMSLFQRILVQRQKARQHHPRSCLLSVAAERLLPKKRSMLHVQASSMSSSTPTSKSRTTITPSDGTSSPTMSL